LGEYVNLRPSVPPFGWLIVLWLVLSLTCRLGAPTWAAQGGLDNPQAYGISGGLLAFFALGVALFMILGLAYVNAQRPLPTPRAPLPAEPVQMATEVERVIYYPADNDKVGWFLDASPEQWRAVYQLTRTRDGIVFNVIDGEGQPFANHGALDRFRAQLVGAGLAYVRGDQVLLNVRGRQMVARYGSPTPPMKGKK
jgi:hypothetical protein